LKAHLRISFGTTHSVLYLQKRLNNLRHLNNKSARDFVGRIEKAYQELSHAETKGKPAEEARITARNIQGNALNIFMTGVPEAINIILLAWNVTTLERL
jgi:hypothetical protein